MRTKNAIKIIFSSTLLQLIVVISGLILPRLLIREYGSSINGLVMSIKQFVTYFSIVGAGIGIASNVALYKPLADDNIQEINGILSATAAFFRQTGFFFVILILTFTLIYPFIVREELPVILIVSLILIISIALIVEHIFMGKYKVLLIADQRNYIVSKITGQGIIINTIISVILIKMHFSIVIVQIGATLSYLIKLYLIRRYIKKNYSKFSYKGKPATEAIKGRWGAFAYQVPGIIITYTPIVVITILCGLKEVSRYAVYNMVFGSLGMIVGIFSAGFSASFGNVIAKNETDILKKSFNTYEHVLFIVTFFCYASTLKLIKPFIAIYTKGITDIEYVFPLLGFLFIISSLIKGLRIPSLTLIEAAGKYIENKNANIAEAVSNILLSIFFTYYLGVIGVLIAYILSGGIRTILYLRYADKCILNRPLKKVTMRVIVNITGILLVSLIPFQPIDLNFLEWVILAIKVSCASFMVIVLINTIYDREASKDLINRLLPLIAKFRINNEKRSNS